MKIRICVVLLFALGFIIFVCKGDSAGAGICAGAAIALFAMPSNVLVLKTPLISAWAPPCHKDHVKPERSDEQVSVDRSNTLLQQVHQLLCAVVSSVHHSVIHKPRNAPTADQYAALKQKYDQLAGRYKARACKYRAKGHEYRQQQSRLVKTETKWIESDRSAKVAQKAKQAVMNRIKQQEVAQRQQTVSVYENELHILRTCLHTVMAKQSSLEETASLERQIKNQISLTEERRVMEIGELNRALRRFNQQTDELAFSGLIDLACKPKMMTD